MNHLSAPIYVGIDLTEKCNLRCLHCRVATSNDKQTELPLKIVKKLMNDLAKMRVIQIIFSGGEPFIRRDIYDILAYTIKSKIPDVSIVSNGTLLDDEAISKLKKTGLKKISLSLDGLKDNHDKIRGAGYFNKTINAIKKLVDSDFEVKVTITLNKINKDDLIKLSKYLNRLGVKGIYAGNLMPCGRGKDIWEKSLTSKEKFKIRKEIQKLNKKLGYNFLFFGSSFLCEPKLDGSEKKIISFLGCRGGRTACYVLANGDVVACKMLPQIVAGNIKKTSFKNVWTNDKYWNIWRKDSLYGKCKICEYGKACRGGCKAITYFVYNRFDLPDLRCLRKPKNS